MKYLYLLFVKVKLDRWDEHCHHRTHAHGLARDHVLSTIHARDGGTIVSSLNSDGQRNLMPAQPRVSILTDRVFLIHRTFQIWMGLRIAVDQVDSDPGIRMMLDRPLNTTKIPSPILQEFRSRWRTPAVPCWDVEGSGLVYCDHICKQ